MRKPFVFLLLVSALTSILIIKTYTKKTEIRETPITQRSENQKLIKVGTSTVFAEIAKTPAKKTRGLSGKIRLNENEGMLFIFANKTYPTFWMKDMLFPLDIIWISDNEIVDIDENVPPPVPGTPDESLPLYTPEKPVNFVLEVNANFTRKHDIKVGDRVDFLN